MKKILFALCLFLGTVNCWALTRGTIVLRKPTKPGSVTPIGSIPRTPDAALFSAFQDVDELLITSEAVSAVVTVNIYNSVGAVVETVTASVAVGGEISVDITNLPVGAYILEIAFDDIVYVGQFEL